MTAFTTSREEVSPKVEAYVRRCMPYFEDLASADQSNLEHDVREIVTEVTAELDGEPADLVGPPHRFAAELRSAAGLPPREAQTDSSGPGASVSGAAVLSWVRNTARPWGVELFGDLRPAWWVARGLGLSLIFDPNHLTNGNGFVPDLLGSSFIWLLAASGLVVGSVQVGRNGPQRSVFKRLVSGVLGALAVVMIVNDVSQMPGATYMQEVHFVEEAVPLRGAVEIVEHPMEDTFSAFVSVHDSHTGETLWSTSSPNAVDLYSILERNPVESSSGFGFEVNGPFGAASGQVPTWDALIEAIEPMLTEP